MHDKSQRKSSDHVAGPTELVVGVGVACTIRASSTCARVLVGTGRQPPQSMQPFLTAHATHAQAGMALALADAQLQAQRAQCSGAFEPTLGLIYLSDHFASQASALLAELQQRWPGVDWVGSVGVGVMASGVEYFDEPALVLMLTTLPRTQYQVFNGLQPLERAPPLGLHPAPTPAWLGSAPRADVRTPPFSALVHADPATADVAELITELADRTESRYLFGGLASSRGKTLTVANGVFEGGLSGVAFSAAVHLISRVTQGSQPVGPSRRITACERNLVLKLDGQPALPALLADLGLSLDQPQKALAGMRHTLVGLTDENATALARGGNFGADTRVRHLIGIDPGHEAVAVADLLEVGQQLAFCRRDVEAAQRDLVRICAEIRDEVESLEPSATSAVVEPAAPARTPPGAEVGARIVGAIYVSCSGRGGPHFGAPSAEALIVQRALGDVPLVGFFAAGEIARHHLYGYTGVLTVFVGR